MRLEAAGRISEAPERREDSSRVAEEERELSHREFRETIEEHIRRHPELTLWHSVELVESEWVHEPDEPDWLHFKFKVTSDYDREHVFNNNVEVSASFYDIIDEIILSADSDAVDVEVHHVYHLTRRNAIEVAERIGAMLKLAHEIGWRANSAFATLKKRNGLSVSELMKDVERYVEKIEDVTIYRDGDYIALCVHYTPRPEAKPPGDVSVAFTVESDDAWISSGLFCETGPCSVCVGARDADLLHDLVVRTFKLLREIRGEGYIMNIIIKRLYERLREREEEEE
jgi:hypothetical protein